MSEIEPMNLEKTCGYAEVESSFNETASILFNEAIKFANSCVTMNLPTKERLEKSISLVKDRIHDLTVEREEYDALVANLGSEGKAVNLLRQKYEDASMAITALNRYRIEWENELKDLPLE
jgi:hypothetical protein